MSMETKRFYEFGNFRVDLREKSLMQDGEIVPLTPKVFDTLQLLIENAGRRLEKDELMQKIWHDRFVEETNLTFNIKMLRKALGDSARHSRFIKTFPRRGYGFIAQVREIVEEKESGNARFLRIPRVDKPLAEPGSDEPRLFPHFGRVQYLSFAVLMLIVIGGLNSFSSYFNSGVSHADGAPILSAPFRAEKLSSDGNSKQVAMSPDGKYVVYTGAVDGRQSLWLRNLEDSTNVQFLPPSDNIYFGLTFSNSGEFLYFSAGTQDRQSPISIYRISIFDRILTKLTDGTQGWISLSPNDKQIAFIRTDGKSPRALIVADINGGNETTVAERYEPYEFSAHSWSPDGKTIAFAAGHSENGAKEHGLFEVDLANGTERELTPHNFFNISDLVWLPHSSLLFTAKENLSDDARIWQLSINAGETEPITNELNSFRRIAINRNGDKMIASRVIGDFSLWLGRLDDPAAPKPLSMAQGGLTFTPGGKIVYASSVDGDSDIWTMNADGTDQRQLTTDSNADFRPVASPDGHYIFFSSNRSGEIHVWRMNSDGTNQIKLTRQEGGYPVFVSPGGKQLLYQSSIRKNLRQVSLESGVESQYLEKSPDSPSFSHDGNFLAYFTGDENKVRNRIDVVSAGSGEVQKSFRFVNEGAYPMKLAWLNDGTTLAYVVCDTDGKRIAWLQRLGDENPRLLMNLGSEHVADLSFSPDGKSFSFIRGSWKHDAVLLEGLK